MSFTSLKRWAMAFAVVSAPCAIAGCGDSGTTTIPTNTPPIPTDTKGTPLPPPSAASEAPSKSK